MPPCFTMNCNSIISVRGARPETDQPLGSAGANSMAACTEAASRRAAFIIVFGSTSAADERLGSFWERAQRRPISALSSSESAMAVSDVCAISTQYPRRSRGVAATRLHGKPIKVPRSTTGLVSHGLSASQPRRRRDPSLRDSQNRTPLLLPRRRPDAQHLDLEVRDLALQTRNALRVLAVRTEVVELAPLEREARGRVELAPPRFPRGFYFVDGLVFSFRLGLPSPAVAAVKIIHKTKNACDASRRRAAPSSEALTAAAAPGKLSREPRRRPRAGQALRRPRASRGGAAEAPPRTVARPRRDEVRFRWFLQRRTAGGGLLKGR